VQILMSSPLIHVAAWLAMSSVKGTVLIGAVVVLRGLLTPATTAAWRHALWLPAVACLISPVGPIVSLTPTSWSGRLLHVTALSTTAALKPSTAVAIDMHQPASPIKVPPISSAAPTPGYMAHGVAAASASAWLALIWAAGAAVLASLYLANDLRFRRIALASVAATESTAGIFKKCAAELRVRQRVKLLESRDIDSPCVIGWWRPIVLLPLGLTEQLDPTQLRHVLLHELAHVKRNDVLVNWAAATAQLIHWFNPIVWLGTRMMRSDMESACDAYVLQRVSQAERSEYGKMLFHLADSHSGTVSPRLGLAMADVSTDLKGRLTMITRFKPASNQAKLALGFALVAFTCVALIQPGFPASSQTPPDSRQSLRVAEVQPGASSPGAEANRKSGVPMMTLVEQVAKNIHKRVVVDPGATSPVFLYGQSLDQITYPDFLTILRINGFTAVSINDYVNVVPVSVVRSLPLPTFATGEQLPDDQFANMSMQLKNACSAELIPLLRVTLSQYAYFGAEVSSNTVLAVDTYANLKRLRATIAELDAKAKPGQRCEGLTGADKLRAR
jgi:bla regulator protein BlaR1